MSQIEPADQVGALVRAFRTVPFNGSEDPANGIDDLQDQRHQLTSEPPFTRTQLAQKVLGVVRYPFEAAEAEEPARALNGMKTTEYAGQQALVLRPLFEFDNLLIQAIQVLAALDQKLSNDFLIRHSSHIGRVVLEL